MVGEKAPAIFTLSWPESFRRKTDERVLGLNLMGDSGNIRAVLFLFLKEINLKKFHFSQSEVNCSLKTTEAILYAPRKIDG